MSTILAFDLGATSARGIVFSLMNGQIKEEKVYRFTDYQVIDPNKDEIHWNIEKIMTNIKEIITLATTEYVIESIGIDTWGCDFGLIDKKGQLVLPPLCYQTMLKEPNLHYGGDLPTHFHERTGIPNASINTSSQLLYLKEHYPEQLNKASTLLMMPDLIHFLLTGTILTESSIASTSQLFDIDKHQWASDLIEQLGISPSLFSTIVLPYTKIGLINLAEKQLPIHSVMSHDTASAIFALPTNDHSCFFLSSGTWSVLGEKSERGILVNHPLDTNYSYEQAGDGKILKLKNMLGMWFIEEALAFSNQTQSITIQQIQDMLLTAEPIHFFFDNEHPEFLSKGQFVKKLQQYGNQHHFSSIEEPQQLFLAIYQNLAFKYAETFDKLAGSAPFTKLYLFGGGSKSHFLTQLPANLTQTTIEVCYSENSALGNALAQFLAIKAIKNREELVTLVTENYQPISFFPEVSTPFEQTYINYKQFMRRNINELS